MFDLFRAKIKKLVRFASRPSIPKIGQEAFFIFFYYLASEIHNSVIYPAYETLRIYTAVLYASYNVPLSRLPTQIIQMRVKKI